MVVWCDCEKFDQFGDGMKVWASVDPKYVNEKANIVVVGYDGCRDLYCLVVGNPAVLFLDCFAL